MKIAALSMSIKPQRHTRTAEVVERREAENEKTGNRILRVARDEKTPHIK
jgi:hypothetical protein